VAIAEDLKGDDGLTFTATQQDCVAAINDFIDESKTSGIVVCCRRKNWNNPLDGKLLLVYRNPT
jgi:hypothetical protein